MYCLLLFVWTLVRSVVSKITTATHWMIRCRPPAELFLQYALQVFALYIFGWESKVLLKQIVYSYTHELYIYFVGVRRLVDSTIQLSSTIGDFFNYDRDANLLSQSFNENLKRNALRRSTKTQINLSEIN